MKSLQFETILAMLSSCQEGISGTSQSIFPFPPKFNEFKQILIHNSSSPKITATWIWPKHVKIHQDSFELVEFDEEFVGGKN